jgi:tetratricopeptide (TPR) repeat protein
MRKIIILCILPVFILSLLSTVLSCQSQVEPISTQTPTVTPAQSPAQPPSPSSAGDTVWVQYYDNGKALAKQGNYEQAILEYTKAIELSADNAMIYQNRGDAYLARGDYDKAIVDYTIAIENTKTGSSLLDISICGLSYLGRAEAYNKKGDYEKATIDNNKATEKQAEFENAYRKAAEEYNKLK